MNEKDILDKLFSAAEEDNVPRKRVTIERVGLAYVMKGLRETKIEQLEKRFTNVQKVRGEEKRKLDDKRFNRALVAEATVSIGDNEKVRWDHPTLLSKYQASGAEAVIKRVLLAGEIAQLADIVLDLSGYYDQAEESDEIKNSSPNEG